MTGPGPAREQAGGTGWRLVRAGAIAAGLAMLFFALGVALFGRSLERREIADVAPAEGIVVLTGGADRISDALALMERGKGRRLFISGVNAATSLDMIRKSHPGHDALFACCVDLDFVARNTFGNAAETRRWVEANRIGSIVLVTASYHLPRALLEFSAAMPRVEIRPYPVVPEASRIRRWWQEPALIRIIALEFVKYWAASARIALGFPAA